ncbi:SGNH/GDSL hydrolase family protein [Streptomyces sp. NPDC088725]|uniref:SGNH/GDSL hydrolase family protein n=1 Tax=Streptomyces sp. NPDC088725 TaxID=3365873 RepID=UPI00380D58F6
MPISMESPTTPGPTVVTWAASAVRLDVAGSPDLTCRLIVRTSAGGRNLRVRLSNAFGERPVVFGPVYAGEVAAGASVVAGTNRPLTFAGSATVTVAPGADVSSDPLPGAVLPQADLAVSVYVQDAGGAVTGHQRAGQTSYLARGDRAGADGAAGYDEQIMSWFHLDAITVDIPPAEGTAAPGAVVAFGDSITDGSASTDDQNRRWPDHLARRLLADPASSLKGVANAGISGNKLLADGAGQSALKRLDRDVLSHQGVRTVVLLEGVNDLKADPAPTAAELIAALRDISVRVRGAGKRLVCGTVLPFHGWFEWTPEADAVRESVNAFIRTSGDFDAVVDFDLALRDPAEPRRMLPEFDSGDHLHPNDAGMLALAGAVDLTALEG